MGIERNSHPDTVVLFAVAVIIAVLAAFVITAGFDPLLDEGRAYADKLRAAGVEVAYREYADMVHGFVLFGGVLDTANAAVADCCSALRHAFESVAA